ncbi:hypothetical protein Amsp01_090120 [Amycolatopsis sp. NBRC 101858]|nr:hypothetical protein Amsp01_090120 [Amycolatopsis sp. NBRC 101858]
MTGVAGPGYVIEAARRPERSRVAGSDGIDRGFVISGLHEDGVGGDGYGEGSLADSSMISRDRSSLHAVADKLTDLDCAIARRSRAPTGL